MGLLRPLPALLLSIALAAGAIAQAGPPVATPSQVGIAYDIVACRMPVAGNADRDAFPDAHNFSLYLGRGTELILIHPDGSEEVIFSPGPDGAVADPLVSFDGKTIYFVRFQDPENYNTQRGVSFSPSHIWKIDVQTRVATQLTFGTTPAWQDTAHQVDPLYAAFDLAPVELPDGRLLFLSTRDGTFASDRRFPAPKFWRMNSDGSNLEPMEAMSQAGCQHPFILADGRIVWTHHHPAGRRTDETGNYPLMVANPDLSAMGTFAGAHFPDTAWHFGTQLSNGDIVITVYYHQNNYGHGTLVRFPAAPATASGNPFTPPSASTSTYQVYGDNDHYRRVGEVLATPWSLSSFITSLNYDEASRLLPDGTRAGKSTMPAAAPGGHMVFVWSPGHVNDLYRPTPELPHMKVCFAAGGMIQNRNDLVILKQSAQYHYLYPKAVVPWQAIHGTPKPAIIPDTPNAGGVAGLVAGGPFATMGTSSVYNRESRWPAAYQDPFDVNIVNDYALGTAFFNIGQDTWAFPDSAIHAAQIVADMSHVDVRYAELDNRFLSHNRGSQIWGILGEVPLRKFGPGGQPILDPQGNPDTSFEARIPANVPVHNRLIDQNGILLTAEWTWHASRPGERKVHCGGCHAHSTDVTPLPFSSTAAAAPGFTVPDLALQTPIVDRDAQGNPTVTVMPETIRIVEYHRDVKPIFQAKCISCHGNASPAGGLDLEGNDAWWNLAFNDPTQSLFGFHQVTRWVRIHAAAQSLLAWKCYGARLDGRTNASRSGDIDFTGTIMPPPGSGVAPLTFMEKRTIANWIDLGCLVDLTPGTATTDDPFDDQMFPTLVVSGVNAGFEALPLPPLRVGFYDLHSGIDPSSLTVRVTAAGGVAGPDLAAGLSVQNGQTLSFPLPALPAGQRHAIDVSVKDGAGNIARRRIEVTPLPAASAIAVGAGTPGQGGITPSLAATTPPRIGTNPFGAVVSGARPLSPVHLFASAALASPPLVLGGGALIHLDPAVTILQASGTTDASGSFTAQAALPLDPTLAGGVVHLQALVLDPAGAPLLPGLAAALTPGLTLTLGW